jgi:hypothetical protein
MPCCKTQSFFDYCTELIESWPRKRVRMDVYSVAAFSTEPTIRASPERACLKRKTITTRASVSVVIAVASDAPRCRCVFSDGACTSGWRWCWCLPGMSGIPIRTLERWRQWWQSEFALTSLWQAQCARFMPPVATNRLPGELLERFAGQMSEPMLRLLLFLTPLTVRSMIVIREGR